MDEADESFVEVEELMRKSGARIVQVMGVEAA